ncbi:hypothetical protein WAK64_17990 [Bacillus spongiae]|uniref:Uncharacterized protein n=1 Tax=Bacillus spongiae TaxID=2683610 RepID=A0ABU8HI36_9BACI
MRIKIIKNEGMYNDQNIIQFTSEFGSEAAIWVGETAIEGREYNVELDISTKIKWRKDVKKSDKERYAINSDGLFTTIVCKVEAFFEEACCCFRIGSSIVIIEMEGDPYPKGTFVQVKVCSQSFYLYDINL